MCCDRGRSWCGPSVLCVLVAQYNYLPTHSYFRQSADRMNCRRSGYPLSAHHSTRDSFGGTIACQTAFEISFKSSC